MPKIKYSLEYFSEKPWSFVFIKGGEIKYRSRSEGLKPLIACIKKFGKEMRGASVYDKVIGKAAATLLAHAKVREVWTPVISRSAKTFLAKNKVKFQHKKQIEHVLNRSGNAACPMEKMLANLGEKVFVEKMLGV